MVKGILASIAFALAVCGGFAGGWHMRGTSGDRKAEAATLQGETCVVMVSLAVDGWNQCMTRVEEILDQQKTMRAWLVETQTNRAYELFKAAGAGRNAR